MTETAAEQTESAKKDTLDVPASLALLAQKYIDDDRPASKIFDRTLLAIFPVFWERLNAEVNPDAKLSDIGYGFANAFGTLMQVLIVTVREDDDDTAAAIKRSALAMAIFALLEEKLGVFVSGNVMEHENASGEQTSSDSDSDAARAAEPNPVA